MEILGIIILTALSNFLGSYIAIKIALKQEEDKKFIA